MRKWKLLLQCFIILTILLFALSACFASPNQQGEQRSTMPIVIKMSDGTTMTGVTAIIGTNEVLVPVDAVIKYINADVSFDLGEKRVYLYIGQIGFRLETTGLDQKFNEGIVLNFSPCEINGVYYLNIKGLEKVLGIKITPGVSGSVVIEMENYAGQQLSRVRDTWHPVGKINLVWDVNTTSPQLDKEAQIAGLDVIAPTWFSIVTSDGFVMSKADAKYVTDAHNKGYKVWALVSNNFDCNMTRQLLADEQAQERVIRQLLVYSSLYNLDGINIDFENIYDEDKGRLTQFVKKLSAALKQQNIVVSMDVTVPANTPFWSNCYDRQQLGATVDYIMVMTYDEYWSKSPISGPVASIGWVETGIKKMLGEVPKEKLLMGLPFYTREWEESYNGRVKAKTMSMSMVEQLVKEKNLNVVWLEDKGLHYTEYYKEGQRYRIWIEDEKSIALKLDIVDKYNLAGAAAWRKGFEQSSIWGILHTGLKKLALDSVHK